MSEFVRRLQLASEANRSLVCVGLDPDPDLMAIEDVAEFNRGIVEATGIWFALTSPTSRSTRRWGCRGCGRWSGRLTI